MLENNIFIEFEELIEDIFDIFFNATLKMINIFMYVVIFPYFITNYII